MKRWLSCIISPGQFSDEFAVTGWMFNGKTFSLFAQREDLQVSDSPLEEGPWGIRVDVLEEKDGLALVRLPQETFEHGQVITVSTGLLSE